MAEEKLGTLQYDMLINQKLLEDQLGTIDNLLKEQDKKWKAALSNVGGGAIDVSKAVAANKAVANEQSNNHKKRITEIKAEGTATQSFAVQQYEIEQKILALRKQLRAETAKTKTKEFQLIPTGELSEMVALAKKIKEETAKLNVIKSQIISQSLPTKLANGTVDFQGYINQLTQAPLKLKRMNEEYAEMEKESNRILEIERKKTAELAKQSERISKLNEKQRLERSKLQQNLYQPTINPLASLDAEYAVLKFDKGNAKSRSDIADLTQKINENRNARKQLVDAISQQNKAETTNIRILKLQEAINVQAVGSIGRLRAELALYVFQLGQINKQTPNATAEIKRLQQTIATTKGGIADLQPTLGMWGKLISAIKTYVTAYISVQAVMGLGRAVFNQTKELDSLNFSMQTVIKSSTELAQTQKFLSDVAVNYGGDLLTLSERYIKFRAAAIQSNVSAAETQKIFESVSKAAGTLGLKTDELSGVYLALEQMLSKGKVTTEELRRQLGERLPGAFGIMANALGVTLPELDKLLKKGEVLSTDALPKFAAALEKAYGIESLTKIDTLAAAQGRMSTQFTGLIKELDLSTGFKGLINGLATFIGVIKDSIGTISLMVKAVAILYGGTLAYRLALIATNAIQVATVFLFKTQIPLINTLSFSQAKAALTARAATIATLSWRNALNSLKAAWASNPIGLIVGGIAVVASAFLLIFNNTKKVSEAMKDFNEEMSLATRNIDFLLTKIQNSRKGSNQFTNALQELNSVAVKYNATLLTEKSTLDEISAVRSEILDKMEEEMRKKRYSIEMDTATGELNKTLDPIREAFFNMFEGIEGGAVKASDAFAEFKDMAAEGLKKNDIEGTVINARKAWEGMGDQMYIAMLALKQFNAEDERLKKFYKEAKGKDVFDIADIDKAKKEFADFDTAVKKGYSDILTSFSFKDEKTPTLVDWLNSQIDDMNKGITKFDATAMASLREALYDAMNPESKGGRSGSDRASKLLADRNEAIKLLNDKYLADQEEFANFDMGIAAGRIAAMEDGIEKEVKLNELAYANRLKAIEKEKIKTLELLNEARDPKTKEITGFDATGYDAKTQKALLDARNADMQKRLNAEQDRSDGQIRIEKDTQLKLKEIRRDAEDQFKTGIEKERAAIDEKYDDWVRKAKQAGDLVLAIELDLLREDAKDEMYRKSAIDRLDFEREIQYKKNEIAQNGSTNQRKLDRLNFETYAKFERQKIALLKADKSTLQQGLYAEEMLIQDEKLFKLKQEIELRGKIIDGIKQVTDELATQLGLSEAEAENLKDAVSLFSSAAKGDYLTAAITAFGFISESLKEFSDNKDESKAMIDFYTKLGEKISDIVNSVSLLNSTLSKIGDTSSIAGVRILQAEIIKLKNDAARLNEELQITSGTVTRRGDVSKDPNSADGGGSGQDRMRIIASMVSQVEYLNEQILILSNKLLDPKLTEEQRKSIEAVLNGYIDLVDAIDQSIQSITGTSVNELSNSIVDAFLNGENAAIAWGEKVNDIIKYMIKQQLISQLLTKPITEAIQTLVTDSEGGLTAEEAAKFKATIKGITDDVAPAINDAISVLKDVGIDITGASDINGISKGIQALTEDTGRRLEGMLNSIRETGVINMKSMARISELIESSQTIQAYASQSLGHLRNIDVTTASQLTLFNEIMTSANGTGGKGMKVYVQ